MTSKEISEITEQFEAISIKKQMRIIAAKAVNRNIYYKEIMEEFERTILQALFEKFDFNISQISLHMKLHRNTIANKIRKLKITMPKTGK